MSRISLENKQLGVGSPTHSEIDAAENFEYDSNLEPPDNQQVSVSGG